MLRYFMLVDGKEIIGVINDEESSFDLKVVQEPWRLLLTNNGYVPAPMPAKNLTIDNSRVLCEGDVDDELVRVYNERHGGIVRSQKGLVV